MNDKRQTLIVKENLGLATREKSGGDEKRLNTLDESVGREHSQSEGHIVSRLVERNNTIIKLSRDVNGKLKLVAERVVGDESGGDGGGGIVERGTVEADITADTGEGKNVLAAEGAEDARVDGHSPVLEAFGDLVVGAAGFGDVLLKGDDHPGRSGDGSGHLKLEGSVGAGEVLNGGETGQPGPGLLSKVGLSASEQLANNDKIIPTLVSISEITDTWSETWRILGRTIKSKKHRRENRKQRHPHPLITNLRMTLTRRLTPSQRGTLMIISALPT